MDRNVYTIIEWFEEDGCCPGVVHRHNAAMPVGSGRYRWDILHLEGVRPRSLRMYQPCIGPDQLFNAGADGRVVILNLDAQPLQHRIAEYAGRPIDGIDDQRVIARREEAEKRHRYRCEARGYEN